MRRDEQLSQLDKSLIAGLPPFRGLEPSALDEIVRGARSARYTKDSAIFEQEAEADRFFLLLSGHVRVVRTSPEANSSSH